MISILLIIVVITISLILPFALVILYIGCALAWLIYLVRALAWLIYIDLTGKRDA